MWTGHKIDLLTLLFREQTVVRPKPRAILRIRTRVIGKPTQANVTTNRCQITSRRVNDVKYFLRGYMVSSRGERVAHVRMLATKL